MNLKTYHAFTMAEALAAVKHDLGHDAVILHTRSFKRGGVLGVGRRTVVEVTATPADEAGRRRPAIARRDAPRRAVAGRAYASLAAPPSRTGRERGEDERRPAAVGRPEPARWVPDRVEPARRPLPPPRVEIPAPAPAAAGPAAARAVVPTGGAAAPREAANLDPVAEAGSDRGGRTPRPVARRFILQPTAAEPATETTEEASAPVVQIGPAASAASTPSEPKLRGEPDGWPVGSSMQDELAAIRRMVGQVLDRQRLPEVRPLAELPPQLIEHYMTLTGQEIAPDLAERILRSVADDLDDRLDDGEAVREALLDRVASLVPVAKEPVPVASPDARPLTIALVGPTGVGKTTTLAKLAAVFKLRDSRRVGLVTADTYRIAAVDQLRTYANIIGLPLEVALTPAEMQQSIHTLSDCDVVLIDTAGRSQNDRKRIDELRSYLEAADPHEVHLVLSATASEPVLRREAEAFGAVGVDKVAVTKLDEAVSFGAVVNVLHAIGRSISFVTTGQEVPDHLEPGSGRRIAELLMGAPVRS